MIERIFNLFSIRIIIKYQIKVRILNFRISNKKKFIRINIIHTH